MQIVLTFKGEIPVGQTVIACVQDLDYSITPPFNKECETGFKSSERSQQ
jgi:hypothetical protein